MDRKEFERVSPEAVGIPSASIGRLLDKLESGFTEPHGLIIMRRGKICAEGWWAPYSPGIRHGLQSHTKTYAATAVGIAYTQGILRLDERLVDIFPGETPKEPSENLKRLTVMDVLCMGCGMDEMPRPTKDWLRDFLATPVNHVPGTEFMYNSVASTVLGAIIKVRTGMGLHEYLKTHLFYKIGIDAGNLRWMHMPDGMEIGGGGLFATTEDNVRLMKLYADEGVWSGERILAGDFVAMATTCRIDSSSMEKMNPHSRDNFVGYGFQMWMCRPKDVYRADGAMGQYTIVDPGRDLIISITENSISGIGAQQTLDVIWEFIDELPGRDCLPDGNGEAAALKSRMQRLALPAPAFSPYNPNADKLSGKVFKVTEGRFFLEDVGINTMMAGTPLPPGIKSFSFSFFSDCCHFRYIDGGDGKCLKIALDGSRRRNDMKMEAIGTVLLSGAWTGANTFEVTARWIETCNERKHMFTFHNGVVEIETKESQFFPFGENIKTTAVMEN